jgi:hypothetical protein
MDGMRLGERWAASQPRIPWFRRRRGSIAFMVAFATMLAAGMAFADNLQSDLNTSTGGLDKTVNRGSLSPGTGYTQDVFLFVDVQPSAVNDPTYPFSVTGSGDILGATFSGVSISGPGTANGQTGTVGWTTPAAQPTTQNYEIFVTFDANTTINESPATVKIQFSIAGVSDITPPVITPTITGTLGTNPWYTSNVTVTFSVTDGESAITSKSPACDATNAVTSDTAGVTFTCTATSGGGTSTESVTIMRDATAPSISASLSPPTPATSGWYNIATGAPTVSFTCSDAPSGIYTCPASHLFGEGENQSYSGTAYDNAGNSNSAGVTNVDVDLTAPAINVTGFNNNQSFELGNLPTVGCSAPTDGTSGVNASTLSGPTIVADTRNGNGVGDVTYRCSVSDNAGNPGSNTGLFHVNYALDGLGIRQPINQDNSSLFKRGQVVPVKFGLPGDEPFGLSTSGWSVKRRTASCTAFDAEDAVLETVPSATASSLIRYDSSADQYIYNADFRTVTLNTCWQVGVVLDDPGSTTIYSAIFKMVK